MFRKPKKNKSSLFRQKKKRSLDDDEDPNDADIKNIKNKKKFRKRASSSDEEDGGNDFSNSESQAEEESTSSLLQQIKNEYKKKGRDGTSKKNKTNDGFMHEFKSSDEVLTQKDLATLHSEHHPSNLTNSRSEREVNVDVGGQSTTEKPARNKFLAGPIKASKFIRTTSRFDYQPDICKDYKDTGFCGFGDSCIYLHDRTNMKTGFVLEQEWELKKKREEERKEKEMESFCRAVNGNSDEGKNLNGDDENALEEDGIPHACHFCRGAFKDPIVTQCGHYFCQVCVLKRVQEECDPTCPICNQDMNGVFNYPTKLVNKKKRAVGRSGTWEEFLIKMRG